MKSFAQVKFYIFVAILVLMSFEFLPAQNIRDKEQILLQSEKYTVYTGLGRDFCIGNSSMHLKMVYDIKPDEVIDLTLDKFMKDIASVLAPKCDGMDKVGATYGVAIYLKDIHFSEDNSIYADEYDIKENPSKNEIPFLKFTIYKYKIRNSEGWSMNTPSGSAVKFNNGPENTWSLVSYRKYLEEKKSNDQKQAAIFKEQEIESKKRAEIEKQEAPKKRIIDERNLSVPVLRLVKPNAPKIYNFAGYSNQKVLENIYNGQFDGFVSRKELDDAVFAVNDARSNINPGLAFEMLANMIKSGTKLSIIIERYRELSSYYFGYHNVYLELCNKNKEIPWVTGDIYKFWLTKNGKFVEGSERFGYSGSIREPYKETHKETYELLAKRLETNPQISEETLSDFRKFLQTEGCSSPAVRNFEANLYLATNLRLPLQELMPPEGFEVQKNEAEKPAAQPKVLTNTKKPVKVKTRPKN